MSAFSGHQETTVFVSAPVERVSACLDDHCRGSPRMTGSSWGTAPPGPLVIDSYRMHFEVTPHQDGSLLRVLIDYTVPERLPWRWLGRLIGRYYARWHTRRMAYHLAVRLVARRPSRPGPATGCHPGS